MLKVNKKYNIKAISIIIFLFIILLYSINYIMILKIESNIQKNIQNYHFSENSYLKGFFVTYDELECKGLFKHQCHLKNFNLNIEKKLGTSKKLPLIISKKTIIVPKSITKPLVFDIFFKDVSINETIKHSLLFNYEKEEYKEIGKEIEKLIFPLDIKIELNIEKINKIIMDGYFKIIFNNPALKIDLYSNVFLKNKTYKETIKIKKDLKTELETELKVTNIPVFAKIKDFEYTLKNKNLDKLFYLIYKLNSLNLKENKQSVNKFNYFYLGVDKNEILSEEEFIKYGLNSLIDFKESINTKDGTSLKNLLDKYIVLLKEKNKTLTIKGINKNNSSIEKTGILIMIDKNRAIKDIEESFEISYELK